MARYTRYTPRRAYRTEPSEDSDLIVALFRFALIIAFTGAAVVGTGYAVGWPATAACIVAAVYTLVLMVGYWYARRVTHRQKQELLARPVWGVLVARRVVIQRVASIVIDLALITAVIHDITLGNVGYLGEAYFDTYFVVVAVAAIWFHREGGIIAGLAATLCVTVLISSAGSVVLDRYSLLVDLLARTVMYLAVGLVIGYLARARDGERRERERLDWELGIARQVQAGMLPDQLPSPQGYDLGVRFVPANVVGGDYYDALIGPDGRLFIAIADVAGKSVYAVMHLSLLRSALRDAALEGLSPQAIAHRLNATLTATLSPNTFISLFCAAIELPTGKMRYVNCGHTPPILLRPGEAEPEALFTGNIVLGVEADAAYEEQEGRIEPGDMLVCCTDGVSEAVNADWQPLGSEGVIAAACSAEEATADGIAEAIMAAAREHSTTLAADDATVLTVRREGPGGTATPAPARQTSAGSR